MEKEARPFKVGQYGLKKLLADGCWHQELVRVRLVRDPTWCGYARKDGTGLAIENPSHLDMFELRTKMADSARPL